MIGGYILRQLTLKSFLCLFSISIFASQQLPAAVITTSAGEAVEATSIEYKDGQLYFNAASSSFSLDRREVRDISFSAKTQKKEISSSDIGDLADYIDKAQALYEKYPDAQSILVHSESNHSHRKDGSNLYRYRGITFVAKDEALWASHVSVGFDPNREKVKIIHARCLTPDGEVHNLKPEQIKISKSTSGSVYFNDEQSLSFSIPEVTVGSLIDYSYEIEEFNPFDANMFSGRAHFQSSRPIGESIVRVSVPIDHTLYYVTKNPTEDLKEPTIIEAVDSRLYTWTMNEMAPIVGEPAMPPARDVVPCLYYSIQKDHYYMHTKLKPMYEKRFELTDAVKSKVDELTKDCKTLNEKIAKLYYFCQQEIRYISIKSNLASNQVGHPAEETLNNKYGDCTDKGMLLAVMLKHIGVEAYPVLILTNNSGKAIREIGIFDSNHCITEVHLDGRVFYLDATATDYRYPYFRSDDHETSAMNVMLATIRTVPLPPPEDNTNISTRKITLEKDGTTHIELESETNGSKEAMMRGFTRNLKPEEYEKVVRRSISAQTADYKLELATHTDPLDFDTPFTTKSSYTLNRFATKSGRYMIFSVPYFELDFPEVSLEKRNFEIQHSTSASQIDKLTIKLPENFVVKYLPPAIRVQSPYVEFEMIYDQQGDEIIINRKMAFPVRHIPVSDYQTYKADLEKIAHSSKQKIFLEEVPAKQEEKITTGTATPEITISDQNTKTTETIATETPANATLSVSSDSQNITASSTAETVENQEGTKK